MVDTVAAVLVAVVAALHLWFLVLEMFLWQKPRGLATLGLNPQDAATTASLAANQGLYNGFLAAGLIGACSRATPSSTACRCSSSAASSWPSSSAP